MVDRLYADSDWLLPLLSVIKLRPVMFLGDDRVQSLYALLSGYMMARNSLGFEALTSNDDATLVGFNSWLSNRFFPGRELWAVKIFEMHDSLSEDVATFFDQLEEYLDTTGRSLPDGATFLEAFREPPKD